MLTEEFCFYNPIFHIFAYVRDKAGFAFVVVVKYVSSEEEFVIVKVNWVATLSRLISLKLWRRLNILR